MSDWTALLILSPIILLIIGTVVVIVVALMRATPADVPTVMSTAGEILCRVAGHLPHNRKRLEDPDNTHEQTESHQVSLEEADQ